MPERLTVIYIAGSSFSGSTLLGQILGTDPAVFNAGELKKFEEVRSGRFRSMHAENNSCCSCGEEFSECPVWSGVYEALPEPLDFNPGPGFSLNNLRLLLTILNPLSHGPSPLAARQAPEYVRLLDAVVAQASKLKTVRGVLDGSKAIYNLEMLRGHPRIDLRVVHLTRDGLEVVNSFRKRKMGLGYAVLSWIAVNVLLTLYLWKYEVPSIRVDYRRFCTDTAGELGRLDGLLGTGLAGSDVVAGMRAEPHHFSAGNQRVKGRDHSAFEGVRYQRNLDGLGPVETFLVRLAVLPFNVLLGTT